MSFGRMKWCCISWQGDIKGCGQEFQQKKKKKKKKKGGGGAQCMCSPLDRNVTYDLEQLY